MLDAARQATPAPVGFVALHEEGPFAAMCGPLFICEAAGRAARLGFRVERRHLNPMGSCHGGMLATFCDMLMPILTQRANADLVGCILPSMSLQLDFLAPAREGDWIEGEVHVLRATRSTVVAQCLIRTEAGLIARASGHFKVTVRAAS